MTTTRPTTALDAYRETLDVLAALTSDAKRVRAKAEAAGRKKTARRARHAETVLNIVGRQITRSMIAAALAPTTDETPEPTTDEVHGLIDQTPEPAQPAEWKNTVGGLVDDRYKALAERDAARAERNAAVAELNRLRAVLGGERKEHQHELEVANNKTQRLVDAIDRAGLTVTYDFPIGRQEPPIPHLAYRDGTPVAGTDTIAELALRGRIRDLEIESRGAAAEAVRLSDVAAQHRQERDEARAELEVANAELDAVRGTNDRLRTELTEAKNAAKTASQNLEWEQIRRRSIEVWRETLDAYAQAEDGGQ